MPLVSDFVIKSASAQGIYISEKEAGLFELYAAELAKWNGKINLTAITKLEEIAIKHFVDSLMLLPYLDESDHLLDIGSGAGFPAIPLKIMKPEVMMTTVDAVSKKIMFQRNVIRLLRLQNINALHARVETLHKNQAGAFSFIVSRAFTRLDNFVELAAPLLKDEGVLVAMKGGNVDEELDESSDSILSMGFEITSINRYSLPSNMGNRIITCMKRR